MTRFEYRPTKDNWYPNFKNNRVRVTIHTFQKYQGKIWHRVCVWGSDDCGMEKDFHGKKTIKQALELYNYLIKSPSVERKTLENLGFIIA